MSEVARQNTHAIPFTLPDFRSASCSSCGIIAQNAGRIILICALSALT
jgi:hypothetical protein